MFGVDRETLELAWSISHSDPAEQRLYRGVDTPFLRLPDQIAAQELANSMMSRIRELQEQVTRSAERLEAGRQQYANASNELRGLVDDLRSLRHEVTEPHHRREDVDLWSLESAVRGLLLPGRGPRGRVVERGGRSHAYTALWISPTHGSVRFHERYEELGDPVLIGFLRDREGTTHVNYLSPASVRQLLVHDAELLTKLLRTRAALGPVGFWLEE